MIRVLVADDHPMTRQGMRQVIEAQADMQLAGEATNGEEALQLARRLQPDILLLDISMPRMNGIEVAKALRDEPPEMRIVIMTGYEENDHYNEALAGLGIRGYLSKRATPQEVVAALRKVYAGQVHFNGDFGNLAAGPRTTQQLTHRELEVLRLVAEGSSNADIAERLFLTESTVRFHLHNLFTKLGVGRRTQLVNIARQRGLL